MEDQRCMPADNCEGKTQNTDPAVSSSAVTRRHVRRARAYIALVMVALAATLGAATYAWFTNNMKVNTNSVSWCWSWVTPTAAAGRSRVTFP